MLLKFMQHSEKEGFDYYKEDGLSTRELELIVSQKDE